MNTEATLDVSVLYKGRWLENILTHGISNLMTSDFCDVPRKPEPKYLNSNNENVIHLPAAIKC
jgi:hypothetical protein